MRHLFAIPKQRMLKGYNPVTTSVGLDRLKLVTLSPNDQSSMSQPISQPSLPELPDVRTCKDYLTVGAFNHAHRNGGVG